MVLAAFVIVGVALVQWKGALWIGAAAAAGQTEKPPDDGPLVGAVEKPASVLLTPNAQEMRDAILAAARTGDIAELAHAMSWNELPPEFGEAAGDDPIAYLKSISADGEGREILAIMANLLALEPAALPIGSDHENNTVFVWPHLAERPLDQLTPAQNVELFRLMPVQQAKAMIAAKKWTWWRLAIGADGTWLTFMKHE